MTGNSRYKSGIVYMVGAGPGHPGLITRMGYELLQSCDAVAYDDLIPLELVVRLPESTERYYVGKRAGKHSMSQEKINDLLVELAKRGLSVVRLKGGDPMIFGRSGEEVDRLAQEGIPFVIVPGVTAASAAAATTGISLTDRRCASWLMLATGHEAESGSPAVPWEQVASLEGKTIVVYMGVSSLSRIVEKLLAGGADPSQPCMVVENASAGVQRCVESPLVDLSKTCENQNIQPPALVLIGDVVQYKATSVQTADRPLAGKRILIIRPAQQIGRFCEMLRSEGAEPIPFPTIRITPTDDPEGWIRYREIIDTGGWCVFTSEAGVRYFFEGLSRHELDLRSLGRFRIAAVGSGTAVALNERGLRPDFIPERSTVRDLAEALAAKVDLDGVNVVRVRGSLSDSSIEETAAANGANVLRLTVYHNRTARWEAHWTLMIRENPPDYIAFTSGSTVRGFVEILGVESSREVARSSIVAAIGPSTAAVAKEMGLKVDIQADVYNLSGLIEAMSRHAGAVD